MRLLWFVMVCFHLCSLGSALTHVRLNHYADGNNVLDQQSLVGAGAGAGASVGSLLSVGSLSRSLTRTRTRVSSGAGASASSRPSWAKGPWPPLKPLYNSQKQRTENEMQYQYRTCNNWAEWAEYLRLESKKVNLFASYMVQERNKIAALPLNQQNSHENQYKLQELDKTYKLLIDELHALNIKASKRERVAACLPNVRSAVSTSISDSVKKEMAIEAAIQEMTAKEALEKTSCTLIQTSQDYKVWAIGAGATCGAAIGNYLDHAMGTGLLFTGLCGASGAFLGDEIVDQFQTIIKKNLRIPEELLSNKLDTKLITSQMIDAQCKDRRAEAKTALEAQRLALTP